MKINLYPVFTLALLIAWTGIGISIAAWAGQDLSEAQGISRTVAESAGKGRR
jgi:hypothetical protein